MGFRVHPRGVTASSGCRCSRHRPNTRLPAATTEISSAEPKDRHPAAPDAHSRLLHTRALLGDTNTKRGSSDNSSNSHSSSRTRLERIWEAEDFLRRFVLEGWGQYALDQATIQSDMTLPQLRRVVGRMRQTDGVRACRRLVRVPVLCDEVAYRLWTSLAAEQEIGEEALRQQQQQQQQATHGQLDDSDADSDDDVDGERSPAAPWRPQPAMQLTATIYVRCWNCGGLCKQVEAADDEDEGIMASRARFRCMECSRVLEADVEPASSSDDSERDDLNDESDREAKDHMLSRRIPRALRRSDTVGSIMSSTPNLGDARPRHSSFLLSSRASVASSLHLFASTASSTALVVADNLSNEYIM